MKIKPSFSFLSTMRDILHLETRPERMITGRILNHPLSLSFVLTEDFHLRPATILREIFNRKPEVSVKIVRGRVPTPIPLSSSIIGISFLGLKEGEQITFIAQGEGAADFLSMLEWCNQNDWRRYPD